MMHMVAMPQMGSRANMMATQRREDSRDTQGLYHV